MSSGVDRGLSGGSHKRNPEGRTHIGTSGNFPYRLTWIVTNVNP
jgi:hypothetical protein